MASVMVSVRVTGASMSNATGPSMVLWPQWGLPSQTPGPLPWCFSHGSPDLHGDFHTHRGFHDHLHRILTVYMTYGVISITIQPWAAHGFMAPRVGFRHGHLASMVTSMGPHRICGPRSDFRHLLSGHCHDFPTVSVACMMLSSRLP